MKIALAQPNPTIGDIAGNVAWIQSAAKQASEAGCAVVFFSELAITGYLPEDLLQNDGFLNACDDALDTIKAFSSETAIVVGHVERNPGGGKPLFNAVSVFRNGRCLVTCRKRLLPNYDVFNENRFFEPGEHSEVIDIDGVRFGITICEDGWNTPFSNSPGLYDDDPVAEVAGAGADVLVNIAASPFSYRKVPFRERMFGRIAAHYRRPLVMTNQAGGVDGIIFDGMSGVFDATGRLAARAAAFDADLLIVDLDDVDRREDPPSLPTAEQLIHDALVCGIRDFMRKIGAQQVHLGLSGGIDSALVAVLAAHALGPDRVTGIMLPSRYSSKASVTDATRLAENLGIRLLNLPIQDTVNTAMAGLSGVVGGRLKGITEENLQARIRGLMLMGWSNNEGSILLNTGNKSELAVGYATLYGDMCGALAVIGDVYKTMVYDVCRWINERYDHVIPTSIIEKAPSAELRPDQKDTDSLPPYEVLDPILMSFVEKGLGVSDIVEETGAAPELVRRVIGMVLGTEFKRKQAPPMLKITGRAFGTGFRFPISSRYRPETT